MAASTAARRDTVHPRLPLPLPLPIPGRPPPTAVLDLGALPTAPGCARAWTREILWEWRLAGLSDTAELIVSELTTNSVLASRWPDRPAIRLILTLDRGELVILVRDFCPGAPRTRHPGADDEGGRGLLLVESMSDRFGWYPADDGTPGKVVFAVLRSSALPGDAAR
jgi:anti-sigma regulatory factor (Ser/Thr protein kinase)